MEQVKELASADPAHLTRSVRLRFLVPGALSFGIVLLFNPGQALPVLASAPTANTLAPDFTWQDLAPPRRHSHSSIYDPVGDRLVIHAGQIETSAHGGSNDSWELSLAAGPPAWTRLSVSGEIPPNTSKQTAIYDPIRGRMIFLIGGGLVGVWALTLLDRSWQQLATFQEAPFLSGASIVYDSRRDRLVTFGGYTFGIHETELFNDVWSFALSGGSTWIQVTPHGTPPSPRYNHVAAYDSVADRMVVFGGTGAGGLNDETWALEFSGDSAWAQLSPLGTNPGARAECLSAYDKATGHFLIFGGVGSSGNDVWSLALQGIPTWSVVTPMNAPPSSRAGASLSLDSARHRLLLHGGSGDGQAGETWELSLGQEVRWALRGGTPPGRSYHTAVYDSLDQRMIVFGGAEQVFTRVNDTWVKDLGPLGNWTKLAPSGTPPSPRVEHVSVLDPVRHRMIVFGGDGDASNLNDSWELALDGEGAWSQLAPTGTLPAVRWSASGVYDSRRAAMVIFGGFTSGPTGATFRNDTWLLSLGDLPEWIKLEPSGIPPSPRSAASAVYDPLRDRMLVFGGLSAAGLTDSVWALSLGASPSWSLVSAIGTPGGRVWDSAIYDTDLDRLVVFGGNPQGNDTWALSLSDLPQWTALGPFEVKPARRIEHASIYDIRNRRLIVYGGFTPGQGINTVNLGDTWALPLSLSDPPTPVLISLVEATAEPGIVRVTWLSALDSGVRTEIYRNGGDGWEAVSNASPDERGYVVFEDRSVIGGNRYGYRVGVSGGGVETMFGEAWVDVPLPMGPHVSFALEATFPNPAQRDLFVAFTLPDAIPATLELFDISGRRVIEQSVGSLGVGRHVVNLARRTALAPGVYLVRLSRGSERLLTKACVVR